MSSDESKSQRKYLKGLIECLLFLSSEPIKIPQIASSLKIEKSYARDLTDELVLDYKEEDRGIIIREVANGYEFVTNLKYHDELNKIFKEKKRENLSKGTLDTLAIIAYKQPLTLAEIEEIRGVSSRAIVANLTSKKLIKPLGQKEVPGRPTLFGTTNEFLLHFGLSKLSDLPTPAEIKELNFDDLSELDIESILSKTTKKDEPEPADDFEEELSEEEMVEENQEVSTNTVPKEDNLILFQEDTHQNSIILTTPIENSVLEEPISSLEKETLQPPTTANIRTTKHESNHYLLDLITKKGAWTTTALNEDDALMQDILKEEEALLRDVIREEQELYEDVIQEEKFLSQEIAQKERIIIKEDIEPPPISKVKEEFLEEDNFISEIEISDNTL